MLRTTRRLFAGVAVTAMIALGGMGSARAEDITIMTSVPNLGFPFFVHMMKELRQVKGLIEERFGALAYIEKLNRQPGQARLTQKMLECGFSPALVRKLADAMLSVRDENGAQVFPTGGTRVLAYPAAHYAVADGSGDHAFMYFNVRMAKGRSAAVHQATGEALSTAARTHFADLLGRRKFGLTVQVDEGPEVFDAKLGNLTGLLAKIKPAVASIPADGQDRTSKNYAFVEKVAEMNVRMTVAAIREKSPVLKEMEDKGEIRSDVQWHVATKRGVLKSMPEGRYKDLRVLVERKKAQIRSLVEHPFHVVKNLFGYRKVSYRGLAKNAARLYAQFALANLVQAKRALLDGKVQGIGAS